MKQIDLIQQFIEAELEQRCESMLPKGASYIHDARKALAATKRLRHTIQASKELVAAVKAVKDWDDIHGYGANDDGYNRLSTAIEAAYAVKL